MSMRSKRNKEIQEKVDVTKEYTLSEALEILKKCPAVKFDESVDVSLKLGVDPKKSDQQVRGTVALPNGSGKDLKVVVLAKGEKMQEAEQAGANANMSDRPSDLSLKAKFTGEFQGSCGIAIQTGPSPYGT